MKLNWGWPGVPSRTGGLSTALLLIMIGSRVAWSPQAIPAPARLRVRTSYPSSFSFRSIILSGKRAEDNRARRCGIFRADLPLSRRHPRFLDHQPRVGSFPGIVPERSLKPEGLSGCRKFGKGPSGTFAAQHCFQSIAKSDPAEQLQLRSIVLFIKKVLRKILNAGAPE